MLSDEASRQQVVQILEELSISSNIDINIPGLQKCLRRWASVRSEERPELQDDQMKCSSRQTLEEKRVVGRKWRAEAAFRTLGGSFESEQGLILARETWQRYLEDPGPAWHLACHPFRDGLFCESGEARGIL